jgi:hypothetical protein
VTGVRARLLLTVVAVVAAFVFWHTGGRADAVCMREAFVPADELSWWPPGVRCTYGEPASSELRLNFWLVPTLLVMALINVGITLWRAER